MGKQGGHEQLLLDVDLDMPQQTGTLRQFSGRGQADVFGDRQMCLVRAGDMELTTQGVFMLSI